MKLPSTQIQNINIPSNKRILAVSDIHGNLDYFQEALKKVGYTNKDVLFIVGDIIEKGPQSLDTLRYVMKLCENGEVYPVIGNVDAYRIYMIDRIYEENAESFYNYLLSSRSWCGSSFYDDLANECGITINSPKDIVESKQIVIEHLEKELSFLASLPTIIETQNFVFVHGGLREKNVDDNADKDVFELTKYDNFINTCPYCFDKYIVTGHWPVALYNETIQQYNPIIDREKRIIALDGGCGIKRECQMNVLIIPEIDCDISSVGYESFDKLPLVEAINEQSASVDSVNISWMSNAIEIIEKGDEFSTVKHIKSGKVLSIPNEYIYNETQCYDYTDYVLPVSVGDKLSVISVNSKGIIAKKNGVVGWYFGEYRY